MTLAKRERNDLRRIMGVSADELAVLPWFRPGTRRLNGFGRHLDVALERLRLRPGMRVLDLPCGQGGVSVPLAERHGVTVVGYDLLPQYVAYANDFAAERGVAALTSFAVGDIRQVAETEQEPCDLLLWVAAPHVWGRAQPTMEALRGLVKNEGSIVIADAYRLTDSGAADGLESYETLEEIWRGLAARGDEIVAFDDHGTSLWQADYRYTRQTYLAALEQAGPDDVKRKIRRVIDKLGDAERFDRENLGCAIWTVRVHH